MAAIAFVGCVVCWRAAGSTAIAAPVTAGEPPQSTLVYDPSMILLSLLLAAVAGVLAVLGVARIRRRRR